MTGLARPLTDARGRAWLARLDPRLKLAWLLAISTLSVMLDSPLALAVLFACAAVGLLGLQMPWRGWLILVGLLLLVSWGTLLSQAIFYAARPRTVLLTLIPPGEVLGWPFPGLRMYREGTVYGLTQSLRMLSVTSAGLSLCLSTSPERLLAALARLMVPVSLAFMTVAALRFLPLMLTEWSTVRQARRLRGYRGLSPWAWSSPVRLRAWVASEMGLWVAVLAASLRRAEALAISVASRGFDPAARRTFYPPLRMRSGEWAALGVIAAGWTAVAAAKMLYWCYLAELYYDPRLRELYDFTRVWL